MSVPSFRWFPRRAVVLALVVVALVVSATACRPSISVAAFDQKVFATSPRSFDRWWRGEQAAANHVSLATVDRWLAASPGRLDSTAARGRPFDVSTDLCSFAPDTGPAFDFRHPCIRHDFAWRNLKRLQARFGGSIDTRARRLAASRQFLGDMQATCAARPVWQRATCGVVARTYFEAVSAVS